MLNKWYNQNMNFGGENLNIETISTAEKLDAKCQEYIDLIDNSSRVVDQGLDNRKCELQREIYELMYQQSAPETLDEDTVAFISGKARALVLKNIIEKRAA